MFAASGAHSSNRRSSGNVEPREKIVRHLRTQSSSTSIGGTSYHDLLFGLNLAVTGRGYLEASVSWVGVWLSTENRSKQCARVSATTNGRPRRESSVRR